MKKGLKYIGYPTCAGCGTRYELFEYMDSDGDSYFYCSECTTEEVEE